MTDPDEEFSRLLSELKSLILTGFASITDNFDRLEDRVDRLEARLDDLQGNGFFYEH